MMNRFILIAVCITIGFFPISAHATKNAKILDVQAIKSEKGIEGWLVQDKTAPVISINFSFEGGLAYEPEDKPGVARLVSILLDEGAGDIKSQDFQEQLTHNAISMGFTAGRDAFYGEIRTLSANKETAFKLLHLALSAPRFDTDAIERMKNANASKIKQDVGDPEWLIARTFNGMLFQGHFYARPGAGDLVSMATISRKDLLDYVEAQFARNVLKVSIAGDISKDDAQKALDEIFSSLPEKAADLSDTPLTTLANSGKTILLPLDTPQTFINVGEEGLSHTDKDWQAAVVMNFILGGGGFDSRLMREIREKRGLTYGVYSSLTTMKYANLLQANFSASNEKAAEALKILKEEWQKLAKSGPTEQEVKEAKDYLTGSLLLQLTSTGDISSALNSFQRDGFSADYINRRNAEVSAVTPADVKRVAARLLNSEKLTTVMVGKPKNINVDLLLDSPPGMREPTNKDDKSDE